VNTREAVPDAVTAAVERLARAQSTRVPCAPVRDLIGTDDLDAAYAVQQGLVQGRLSGGVTVVGRKIGATSKAVQDQLGVDQPDFGYLLSDMDVSDDDPISMRTLVQPRVEAEVAFRLARDIDVPTDEITLDLVREAVDVALPALEIVDSRIADWDIGFTDTVADNASSGLFVVGTDGKPLSRPGVEGCEPVEVEMALSINGEVRSSGNGAACLGDPLEALRWLAVQSARYGDPLRAGQLVLSGALGPFVPFAPGDRVEASISGFDTLNVIFGE
jgi:2-keto-4-pentenoate hydratase